MSRALKCRLSRIEASVSTSSGRVFVGYARDAASEQSEIARLAAEGATDQDRIIWVRFVKPALAEAS
jgi:hypothetical protein